MFLWDFNYSHSTSFNELAIYYCRQFLMGLKKYGKGDWRNISRNFVTTRTPTQVASHAQKYFIRQLAGGKDKRRASIHDITMVNLQETKPPSSDQSHITKPASSNNLTNKVLNPHQNQKLVGRIKQEYDMPTVFNPTNIGNVFLAPIYGISSYESKPLDQCMLRGNLIHGFDHGPYNDTILQVQSMQHQ